MFYYGCRIDPASLWLGNLSGCTYSEGGSWRKFNLKGLLSEIRLDATLVLPFIAAYVMEEEYHALQASGQLLAQAA